MKHLSPIRELIAILKPVIGQEEAMRFANTLAKSLAGKPYAELE